MSVHTEDAAIVAVAVEHPLPGVRLVAGRDTENRSLVVMDAWDAGHGGQVLTVREACRLAMSLMRMSARGSR